MKVRSIQGFLLASAVLGLSADPAHADSSTWRNPPSSQGGGHSAQRAEAAMRTNRSVEPFGPPASAPALSSERMSAAAGHYARARSLLIEALAEFQRGEQIARPDLILDSDQWRKGISSRKDDLDRLLNPQPKVSRAGARFVENRELLRTPRERMPAPAASQPPVASTGRAQLRGGGISPADAILAPKPERASKLRIGESSETGEQRPTDRPESGRSRSVPANEEQRPDLITIKGEEAPTVSKAPTPSGSATELLTEVPASTPTEGPKTAEEKAATAKAKSTTKSTTKSTKSEAGLSELSTSEEGSIEKPVSAEQLSSDSDPAPDKQEQAESAAASKVASEEDPAVTSKIEDALIQERLKRLAEDYIAEEKRTKNE